MIAEDPHFYTGGLAYFSLFLLVFLAAHSPEWRLTQASTDAGLRGLCAVSDQIVWASGTGGAVLRTIDGGDHWTQLLIPGAEGLDFRDVEAFDATNAVVLSSGPGKQSSVYVTRDGGKAWQRTLQNSDADGFFDAIAFADKVHGYLIGDPVAGRFVLYETVDGGASWKRQEGLQAQEGEGLFAGSGTCLIARGKDIWFGTGGARVARVFHSTDGGKNWIASDAPVEAGRKSAGIFSLALSGSASLVAVGGDYQSPNETKYNAAISHDHGLTWESLTGFGGYRSGAVFMPRSETLYAVGSNGSDLFDGKRAAKRFSSLNLNVVSASPGGAIWAAGPHGALARLIGN